MKFNYFFGYSKMRPRTSKIYFCVISMVQQFECGDQKKTQSIKI